MGKTRIFFLSEENESISFLEDVLSNVDGYETFLCPDSLNAVEDFRRFLPAIAVVDLDKTYPESLFQTLQDISPATRFMGVGSDILHLNPFQQRLYSGVLSKEELRLRFMTVVNELKQHLLRLLDLARLLRNHGIQVIQLALDVVLVLRILVKQTPLRLHSQGHPKQRGDRFNPRRIRSRQGTGRQSDRIGFKPSDFRELQRHYGKPF